MRGSLQHWLYSSLVYVSGLFVGVDQAPSLHNPDTQLPSENAEFPMPQQLAYLTLAEVEDLVPVITPMLIPIFGPLGLHRYPSKPVSMAVQVATVSIFTYLQTSPPMDYEYVIKELLSCEVPQVNTTIKPEQQASTRKHDGDHQGPHAKGDCAAKGIRPCELVQRSRRLEWATIPIPMVARSASQDDQC